MKFKGPCVKCGKTTDKQYIKKMCIACYQKYHYSTEFQPRKKYTGPCVKCGALSSPNDRFVRKMCSTCYGRFKHGIEGPKSKFLGPCTKCGNPNPGFKSGFIGKKCRACWFKDYYAKRHPSSNHEKVCIDCGENCNDEKDYIKQRCRKCYRKWRRKNNPEAYRKELDKNKGYKKTEKGREAERNNVRKRRATLAQVENTLTQKEWQEILNQFGHKCVYCGATEKIEMDHIIPISKGGPHTKNNVVPACRNCNGKKNNRQPLKPVQPLLI